MRFLSVIAATATAFTTTNVASNLLCDSPLCARDLTPLSISAGDIQRQLGPQLSKNATIYASNDPRFANATARWQVYHKPNVSVVVQPGVESDIATTVKYANSKSINFLPVSRGHGSTLTLGRFKGIEIYTHPLKKITLSADKKSAHLQAGVYDQQVISALWDQGYVTNTGSCGCVGLLGPSLGGGHGRYQGFYGVLSDTFLRLNVVLANGTEIVVSNTSHPDLFWGMKGAGHNFGIVTSFDVSIFPRTTDTWYQKSYTFSQDKLEQVFAAVNKVGGNGTQPKEFMNFGLYQLNTSISATDPVLAWTFEYVGSEAEAQPFLKPFDDIGPLFSAGSSVPYSKIPDVTGTGVSDPLCDQGLQRMQFPAGLQVYNITTQRAIYNLFREKILAQPALSGSFIVLEAYSVEGVRKVDPKSSAFPLRDDYLLVDITVSYPPNSSYDDYAIAWGHETVKLWNEGQPTRKPTAYVNYAFGDEPLEQMYGYEPWRLEKLKALKRTYDPYEKFSFYNPIPLH